MKVYEAKNIRNVAVCGASGSGKTQLVESILYSHNIINRLGKVEEGSTVSDYDPIEKERSSSSNSSIITFEAQQIKFNLIDTPGYADFYGSTVSAIEMAEIILLVINPHEGVDNTTKKIWKKAQTHQKTVVVFINFMDNAPGDFSEFVENLKTLSPNIAPITAPLGKAEGFRGIINLLKNVAVESGKETDISEELKEKSGSYSESLIDSVAAADDVLMEKFLDEGNLSSEDLQKGLSKGLLKGDIVPLLCGSAIKVIGVKELIDFIATYTPSPLSIPGPFRPFDEGGTFKALVFKSEAQRHVGLISYIKVFSGSLKAGETIYNLKDKEKHRVNQISLKRGNENINVDKVVCGDICALVKIDGLNINDTLCASTGQEALEKIEFPDPVVDRGVYPKSKGDEEKVAHAFSSIIKEDPTLEFGFNGETKEMVIKGMGTLQLELVVKRIKNRFQAEIDLTYPKIAYKETARKKMGRVRGKYKKQTGGRGQYGDTVINLDPLERGNGFEFVNDIVGGKIPSNYIPAVEKGVKGAMEKGVISGYEVVDIRISLIDGSFHEVDSSDLAFQVAGSLAFQNAIKDADPYILEPIMKIKIKVSNDYTGAVMGDLNSRRGRVLGVEPLGDEQVINSLVPKALLTTYAEDLRSITSGEGEYTAEFDHYEEAPQDVQQKLISIYQKKKEEGR